MIKLVNILNEIKIISKITPEMVGDLYKEVGKVVPSFSLTITPIFKKYGFFKTKFHKQNGGEWDWFETLDRKQLESLYQDLLKLKKINEIRIIPALKITAFKNKHSPKGYLVKIDDKNNFTIHKHKNHVTLYPSFDINSPKYKKIREYLASKDVPFEEFSNDTYAGLGQPPRKIINLRIFEPQKHINFVDLNGPKS